MLKIIRTHNKKRTDNIKPIKMVYIYSRDIKQIENNDKNKMSLVYKVWQI